MSHSFIDPKKNYYNVNTDSDTTQKKIDPVAQLKWLNTPQVHGGWGLFDNQPAQMFAQDKKELDGGFTAQAWIWVEKLLNKIESIVEILSGKLDEKTLLLSSGVNDKGEALTDKKKEKLSNQINVIRNQIDSHLKVVHEVNMLASSNQVYDVVTSNKYSSPGAITGTETVKAGASFNFNNGNFEIVIPSNAGLGIFAHELLHAYQFETGDYSVGPELSGENRNLLYDKFDEVDAYARQDMYGSNEGVTGISSLPKEYAGISEKSVDVTTHPNISVIATYPEDVQKKAFQNIANSTGHAFRVNGVTYYKKK